MNYELENNWLIQIQFQNISTIFLKWKSWGSLYYISQSALEIETQHTGSYDYG